MYPLNYAILKHFTKVEEACADCVMEALSSEYSTFKAFKKDAIINALMTAEANGLLEESRFDLDSIRSCAYTTAPTRKEPQQSINTLSNTSLKQGERSRKRRSPLSYGEV